MPYQGYNIILNLINQLNFRMSQEIITISDEELGTGTV